MRRREFLALIGAAASLPSKAQQPGSPVLGYISARAPDEAAGHTASFFRGLAERGYVPGRNLSVEYRWAEGRYERLPTFANELVGRRVAVMAAVGGLNSASAAKAASSTTPIVFIIGDDPVRLGLVQSFNRPGTNVTGVSLVTTALGGKRLELLCQLESRSGPVALLMNPANPNAQTHVDDVQTAATALGRRLIVVPARIEADFETGFTSLAEQSVRALVIQNEPFFDTHREQLVALSARHRLPAIYHIREFPEAGGLMSYGPSLLEAYYQAGVQVSRILDGASPHDLPVLQPTKFELVINLKAAKALGLAVPLTLQAQADDVIE
ncbi:MAG TPA: ABC transporter substrate-binding protein [Beijerinckiaceae bacterium]|jgi:putative ABC transport system substrate-binding protein